MNVYLTKSIFILCALFPLVNGCSDRKVLSEIPSEIRGVWVGMYSDPETLLIVKRGTINVINRGHPLFMCRSEEVVSYKIGWIFQKIKVAVICDKGSTDKDQREVQKLGIIAPNDYRKIIYFSTPNELGEISVVHTKYMSKGYAGSEDTYKWNLDDFYKK